MVFNKCAKNEHVLKIVIDSCSDLTYKRLYENERVHKERF